MSSSKLEVSSVPLPAVSRVVNRASQQGRSNPPIAPRSGSVSDSVLNAPASAVKGRKKRGVKCSYCGKRSGHNARSCPEKNVMRSDGNSKREKSAGEAQVQPCIPSLTYLSQSILKKLVFLAKAALIKGKRERRWIKRLLLLLPRY